MTRWPPEPPESFEAVLFRQPGPGGGTFVGKIPQRRSRTRGGDASLGRSGAQPGVAPADPWRYGWPLALVAAVSVVGVLAWPWLAPTDVALLYLLGIAVSAFLRGRGPALVGAGLSVAAYNFFFVEPFHTFRVADTRHLVTFAVMVGAGLALSALAERLRLHEADALFRERCTAALYTLSRALAGAYDEAQVRRLAEDARREPGDSAYDDAVSRLVYIATERIREARAAQAATLRARTEELRAALLSAVSHDLRTPLAAITGSATTLRTVAGVLMRSSTGGAALDPLAPTGHNERVAVQVKMDANQRVFDEYAQILTGIWRLHVPPRATLAPDVDVAALARRYDVAGGYIKNAMLNAVAAAVAEDATMPMLRQAHLDRAARDQCRRPGAEVGVSRLSEARATLADVALPVRARRQVDELVQAAAAGRTVFERWGVAAKQSGGRGTVGLFHGPPGTGKTLCAEAIAGELGRPLLRVTLPSVLSKWVGEAERALTAAFNEATTAEAVIVLDEVDTLLMERGAARASRHDDGLVNTLLDLIDRHEGVVLLCTNRPAVLDPALDRRVGWSVAFVEPDETSRAAIWSRLLTPEATGGVALDLRRLASRYALTGGRIRNAVIRAAMRAARDGRVVTAVDLERAAAEETGEQVEGVGSLVVADA